jgi:hypothetical protein
MGSNSDREMRTSVRTFMVRLRCAKCADGEMRSTGFSQPTHPMRYGHRCHKCGAEEFIPGKSYPCIEHEEERGFVA